MFFFSELHNYILYSTLNLFYIGYICILTFVRETSFHSYLTMAQTFEQSRMSCYSLINQFLFYNVIFANI